MYSLTIGKILLQLVAAAFWLTAINAMPGQQDIYMDDMEINDIDLDWCGDTSEFSCTDHIGSGKIDLKKPLDDKITIRYSVFVKGDNNEYEQKLDQNVTLCSFLSQCMGRHLTEFCGFPSTCPTEVKVYECNNLIAIRECLPPNIPQDCYKWKLVVMVFNGDGVLILQFTVAGYIKDQ